MDRATAKRASFADVTAGETGNVPLRQSAIPGRLAIGTVYVNCHGMLDPVAPFGGYKHSGIGRELGRQGVELYTETKTVFMAV